MGRFGGGGRGAGGGARLSRRRPQIAKVAHHKKKCTVTSWHANRPHDPRRPRITHHTIGPHQSRHPLQSRPPLETRQPRGPYDPHLPHATRWPWRTPTPRVSRQASWALKKKKSVPWYIYYIKVASTPRVSRQASPRQKKIWKVSALLNI